LHLDHVVFGHQHRLLPLLAVGAPLAPHLGPLDPGGLVGGGGAGAEGEEAGEEDGVGQLLANGLMGHLPHIHHGVGVGGACQEESRGERDQCQSQLFLITPKKTSADCFLLRKTRFPSRFLCPPGCGGEEEEHGLVVGL